MTQPPKPPPRPLTDPEMIKVIQASGYPLEMALYDQFEKAGMDPTIGTLMRMRDPGGDSTSTHEIDLMVRGIHSGVIGGFPSNAGVLAWIDAKQLHDPARFVGILGVQPDLHNRRVMRSFYTGCPSFRVLERDRPEPYSQTFLGPGGVSEALDALSDAPLCVHWGIAKPDGNGLWKVGGDGNQTPQGYKEERYYQSMSKLVATVVWHERDASHFFEHLDPKSAPMPSLAVNCPTLIVDTPSLQIYDVKQQSITHTDWFMLRWGAEINGDIHYRIIDVVTVKGVPAMITRYQKAKEALGDALTRHVRVLGEAGIKLRSHSET